MSIKYIHKDGYLAKIDSITRTLSKESFIPDNTKLYEKRYLDTLAR